MSVNEIYERAASGRRPDQRPRATRPSSGSTAPFGGQQSALGSGFVIDKTGHIVTNYHVVEGADEITVSFSNRDTVEAELVGTDPSTDLAVLRVETSRERPDASPARQLRHRRGRRPGRRDRQPVRARPHRDLRDRERRSSGSSPLRTASRSTTSSRPTPDQPGQLGRPAPQRPRPGHRRQHADRDRRRQRDRQRRDRLRRPLEHREGRRRADPANRPRRSRRTSASAARPITTDVAETYNLPVDDGSARRVGDERQRRRQGRPRRAARRRSSSPARRTSSAATSSSPPTARRFPRSNSSATRSPVTSPATRSSS